MPPAAAPPDALPAAAPIAFVDFFLLWAERQRWEVPQIHLRAARWLETRGSLALLRCFRGFAKSTLLDCHNAWRLHQNPAYRLLMQSESDPSAARSSRGTQFVLRHHPLTAGWLPPGRGTVQAWSVPGAPDPRNPSYAARGILSNVVGARADEAQNDDVEVPRNIGTPEAREKLRERLGEQVHILVPGGKRLFVGTPHTHDSLYDDIAALGADCLTIPLFGREWRATEGLATRTRFPLPFRPELLFAGIGQPARALVEGLDWRWDSDTREIRLAAPPEAVLDAYADNAWPARFSAPELLRRRRETRTLNAWDSQYQLHSRPVQEVRLDPARLRVYAVEPVVAWMNRHRTLWLGKTQLVGVATRWDPASGQPGRDASSVSVVYTDAQGRYYWHRCLAITGGADADAQCRQVVALLAELALPSITVEVNGPGLFLPAQLRKAIRAAGLACAVVEDFSTARKAERILDAFEAPLGSGFLWAHASVADLDGPVYRQMRDFQPLAKRRPDDHLDSGAGAIAATPVRVGTMAGAGGPGPAAPRDGNLSAARPEDWRPSAVGGEVSFDVA